MIDYGRKTAGTVLGIALALPLCASVYAAAAADRPTSFRAGDELHFCNFDLKTDEKRGCYSIEFVETRRSGTADAEHMFLHRGESKVATEFRTTADLATKFRGSDNALFEPHNFTFQFPLTVGAKWRGQYDIKFSARPDNDQNRTKIAEVVSFEEVSVPAGKFSAFKIKYDNWRNAKGITLPADELVYYCPDVGYICLYESNALGSVRTRLVQIKKAQPAQTK